MIITNIIGGLGNQMFQYAAGLALAESRQTLFKLDLTQFSGYSLHNGFELNKVFNCKVEIASDTEIEKVLGLCRYGLIRRLLKKPLLKALRPKQYVVEPHFCYWDGIKSVEDNVYLDGYWQSWRYFIEHEAMLRTCFTFKAPLAGDNLAISEQISKTNAVSVHIRRGDYVSNKVNRSIYYECSADYYNRAIDYISSRVKEPRFFVFSDDVPWCKTLFASRNDVEYISHNHGKNSYVDMQLMSLCKHNIIANSTFSWWGAWLNNNPTKIVISPKEWFVDGRSSDDLIAEQWVRL